MRTQTLMCGGLEMILTNNIYIQALYHQNTGCSLFFIKVPRKIKFPLWDTTRTSHCNRSCQGTRPCCLRDATNSTRTSFWGSWWILEASGQTTTIPQLINTSSSSSVLERAFLQLARTETWESTSVNSCGRLAGITPTSARTGAVLPSFSSPSHRKRVCRLDHRHLPSETGLRGHY